MTIDSLMKMEKTNYPQVYLEECKYKIQKMSKFINTELESEPHSQSELDLKFDTELGSKLKSDSTLQAASQMVTS